MNIQNFKKRAAQDLKEVGEVLKRNGITFHLQWGTCLGAVREGDFIEWDYDIDLGSFDNPPNEVRAKIVKELKSIGFASFWSCDYVRIRRLRVNPVIPIDLYFFTRDGENCFAWRNYEKWQKIEYKYLSKFKTIQFNNGEYLVPDPPEEYLTRLYKDWKIRIKKEPIYYKFP